MICSNRKNFVFIEQKEQKERGKRRKKRRQNESKRTKRSSNKFGGLSGVIVLYCLLSAVDMLPVTAASTSGSTISSRDDQNIQQSQSTAASDDNDDSLCYAITTTTTNSSSSSSSSSSSNSESTTTTTRTNSNVQRKRVWNWNPASKEPHRCNIERVSLSRLIEKFGPKGLPPMYAKPLIIVVGNHTTTTTDTSETTDDDKNKNNNNDNNDDDDALLFHKLTKQSNIYNLFAPEFRIKVTSSNSISEHSRTLLFSQYLNEILLDKQETSPDELSNETWYFFGNTHDPEWEETLLRHYRLPPCVACCFLEQDDCLSPVALSFGIGNRGSGVSWHIHGPGFSEAIWGSKHWVLYPKGIPPPHWNRDESSRHWMEYVYTNQTIMNSKANNYNSRKTFRSLLKECTIHPGEVIYFPDMWYHATINLDPYTVFVSTFTSEHDYVFSL